MWVYIKYRLKTLTNISSDTDTASANQQGLALRLYGSRRLYPALPHGSTPLTGDEQALGLYRLYPGPYPTDELHPKNWTPIQPLGCFLWRNMTRKLRVPRHLQC
jgi:hypothetical protein